MGLSPLSLHALYFVMGTSHELLCIRLIFLHDVLSSLKADTNLHFPKPRDGWSVCVSPSNSYVEALTPKVAVFGDRAGEV